MKPFPTWRQALLLLTLSCTGTAFAVTPAEEVDKKCIKPKFRDYSPPNHAQAAPGSEISFHVNRLADPLHISASAKQIPLKLEIVDKKTFYFVSAKLPPELRDTYARIHIEAKALEGECIAQDGWLLNLSGAAGAGKQAATPEARGVAAK
ncbi:MULTISPECIES: hypothetical protein [Methylomonas]|uniref:hypothetical protein n=1 Tax=Methylomonas TaxID=416 RepID=UPI001232EB5B|nr:hypothetical protein [Methylomonas rhizoryzae]